jgi:hypothetical protein
MYLLAHRYTQSRAAAFFAAVGFIFSGYFLSRVGAGHLPQLQTSVWLPWAMLALEKALEERPGALRWAVVSGLCLALAIFAGFPETVFFMGLTLALRAAWEMVPALRDRRERRWVAPLIARIALLFIVAGGMAAVQLLPTLELVGQSARVDATATQIRDRSLPPYNLATLLVPEVLGSAALSNAVQGALISEAAMYTGVLSVLFALGALLMRRDRITGFYLFLALVSLLLAVGGYTPVFAALRLLPGFKQVGAPVRFVFLTTFAVPMLAALVVQAVQSLDLADPWQRRRLGRLMWLAFAAAVLAAVAAVAFLIFREQILEVARRLVLARYPDPERQLGKVTSLYATQLKGLALLALMSTLTGLLLAARMRPRLGRNNDTVLDGRRFASLAVALLLLDILFVNYKSAQVPPSPLPRGEDYHAFLRSDGEPHRFLPLGGLSQNAPDANLVTRTSSVLGYDPIILRDYRKYLLTMERISPDQMDIRVPLLKRYDAPLMYDLNVKYVLSRENLDEADARGLPLVFTSPGTGVRVYQKTTYGPRAYIVYRVEVTPGGVNGVLAALEQRRGQEQQQRRGGAGTSPPDVAYVNQPLPTPVPLSTLATGADSEAPLPMPPSVTLDGPNRVLVRASLAKSGLLVLNEVYYPGWQVRVNGQKAPLVRVNAIFRGVPLSPGQHTVEFVYAPASFVYGVAISLTTLALVAATMLFSGRAARRRGAVGPSPIGGMLS